MKTQLIRNLSVALLAASSMFAQAPQKLTAQIPFGFHVGPTMLAPGAYSVYGGESSGLVRLTAADSTASVMVLAQAAETMVRAAEGKLVFHRYGDEYFLSEIWRPGETRGSLIRKSKLEKEVAANVRRGDEIVIAAK